ncbi:MULTISPECIES: tripartite tricarboxylate transporter TctB family protein [unclassified Mesorhizobium]|uniref:tripartite tricarboxylate transporter TctB family protein n=1 Tax=unclassified Mesorhizobium TaxID=325217 RepID=UPI000F74C1ED|nr:MULTISPECIES: tripartite tricarboxylate transporter TctB family protein [unclassified Mesorhizobium]AZO03183.1 tripartite tricarboxylate transporter TctB family protein [Mesorhizobium sp. M2A.F.Ca.ET.043.02.1.1]RUW42911.1 tripartite tricarboxylate transporter TctB family protein [Mesorhizobium sp. M2A.F.Ca.ET.015.02.1.1]RUW62544.1 tripartite tricarboxylate transporter TctB family protein [Mesorhizobium sp. M2A.F.Ca.ET.067.02.1.1]RVC96739.1 tripartite tricarboxylate transporter TctB family pr
MSTSDHQASPPGLALPELLIGVGLLACACAVAWQTLAIPVSPLYSKVGPTVFPYITMAGMILLSLLLILAAIRGGWQPEEEKETPTDWKAMGLVAAGLVANLVLIQPLGFTAASVIMFVLVCFGFGSRHPLRDALLGLVLALAAYFGFAKALGVNIGAGLIENQLNALMGAMLGGKGG